MNPDTLKRLLLLEQSGELSARQHQQLNAELASSSEARQQKQDLLTLTGAIPPVEAKPAPDAAARIAKRLRQENVAAPVFRPLWKPILAAAAVLTILLGVRAYRSPVTLETGVAQITVEEEIWVDPFEADFAELDSLIAEAESDNLNEFMAL